MTLDDWLDRIDSTHPKSIDLGLDRVRRVADRLDLRPDATLITVAGTNGKGSTCCLIESILRASGQRVGLYSSPHFLQFNERIQIDGLPASDGDIVAAFEAISEAQAEITLTYFEYATLAAFYLFKRSNLDVCILEVGLGGRLDAVNVIDPDIAVVTTIGFDHMDWLGDTLEKIGFEKAGIFRSQKPAICNMLSPPNSIEQHARALDAKFFQRDRDFDFQIEEDRFSWNGQDRLGESIRYADLPLPGLPVENLAGALQAVALLDQPPPVESVHEGIAQAKMLGRMQRVDCGVHSLILDVAHNPQAAEYIHARLSRDPEFDRCTILIGMLDDKDQAGVLSALEPLANDWHLASLDGPRGSDARAVSERLKTQKPVTLHSSVGAALDQLLSDTELPHRLLVCGSFLTVTEALIWLNRRPEA